MDVRVIASAVAALGLTLGTGTVALIAGSVGGGTPSPNVSGVETSSSVIVEYVDENGKLVDPNRVVVPTGDVAPTSSAGSSSTTDVDEEREVRNEDHEDEEGEYEENEHGEERDDD